MSRLLTSTVLLLDPGVEFMVLRGTKSIVSIIVGLLYRGSPLKIDQSLQGLDRRFWSVLPQRVVLVTSKRFVVLR